MNRPGSDWLTLHDVPHEREPPYPDSNHRADFLVNGKFVEYFGLVGDVEIRLKRALAKTHHLDLVEISPKDLSRWGVAQKQIATKIGIELLSEDQVAGRRHVIASCPVSIHPTPRPE